MLVYFITLFFMKSKWPHFVLSQNAIMQPLEAIFDNAIHLLWQEAYYY